MLHEPPDRVGGRGSDDDSPALREPDVVDAHRHGLVAERVREPPAHDRQANAGKNKLTRKAERRGFKAVRR